ncbi:MAG TPA: hypothetical protein VHL80_13835, partial [Polyangia bacterium]|nr:hypothetical protein [Polyangia bacterium]
AAGATGTAGATGAGGSGASGTIASNLGSTPINVSRTADAASLVLVSSNLVPDPTSTINYVEWFGEIENAGASPACLVKVTLDFQSGAGTSVLMLEGYADSDPYMIGTLDLPSACIPPGRSAGVWSNDLPSAPVKTSSITQVNASISLLASSGAVPHPDAPSVTGAAIAPDTTFGAGNFDVDGTLTAVDTIYNIAYTAYFRGSNGLLVSRGEDVHLDTLLAGSAWPFSAHGESTITGTPAGFLGSDDFLSGAKTSSSNQVTLPEPLLRVRDEIAAFRALRQDQRARANVRALGARPLAAPARTP